MLWADRGVAVITQTKRWGAWAEQRVTDLLQGRVGVSWSGTGPADGEVDLVMTKGDRLSVVEVKGRRSTRWAPGRWIAVKVVGWPGHYCWRARHPDHAGTLLEVVVAVVPLPPASGAVHWTPLEELS